MAREIGLRLHRIIVARGPVPREFVAIKQTSPRPWPRITNLRLLALRNTPDNRSAGACPPRCLRAIVAWRGTGPRPTVKGSVFFIVVRGPVPREFVETKQTSPRPGHGEGNPLACACGMRGPKPYGAAVQFWLGEGNPLACACGMRGPKPYGAAAQFWNVPSPGAAYHKLTPNSFAMV